jgi:hypothetical protein
MSEFRVYRHPSGQLEAVKIGWSWPGAVFEGFWALYKKLWIIGSVVIIVSLVLHAYLWMTNLPLVFDLACAAAFGYFGNSWREVNLVDRGVEQIDSVDAKTPEGATAEHLRNQAITGNTHFIFSDLNSVQIADLGAASDGIAPLSEAVTLQLDSYSVTITLGSFTPSRRDGHKFKGTIADVSLDFFP